MAKRISIINFKGGVGKTTLAFHIGTLFAWCYEAKVLLVDMDHQSSLSVLCLGAQGWQEAVNEERTVLEVFRPFVDVGQDMPSDDIVIRAPMRTVDTDYNRMDILPSTLELDDLEIEITASTPADVAHPEWTKRTLICRWIEDTGIDDVYDYIIFDCPPATKIVSQNAVAASHGYIIPVVPEAVMERGAPHLRNMMQTGIDELLKALAETGEPRPTHVPDTELVGLVVTRFQVARGGSTIDHRRHLVALEDRWGNALIEPYIFQGTGVSAALADGVPVYNRAHTQNVGGREIEQQFYELLDEVKGRIDLL